MTACASLTRSALRLVGLGGFAAGLLLTSAASAQDGPPPAPAPAAEAAPEETASAPAPRARARTQVTPYLEVDQVLSADFNGGDVLTYTSVAAGVDGRVVTRRVTAQVNYRYDRRIAWQGDIPDSDAHSGAAQLGVTLVPNLLNFDAGALVTRVGEQGRGSAVTDRDLTSQLYSFYAGPSIAARFGRLAVNASYQFGYAAVDDGGDNLLARRRNRYDSSTAHIANASVGMAPGGGAPLGWTLGAGYVREDGSDPLDSVFEGTFVRGDVVVPLTPTLAVTAGVGYERIESSQDDIARNSNGNPIVLPNGDVVPDPSRPRVLAYETDGLIYDAGIIWRPTSRTELQARAGHRYGGTTFVGSFSHRFNGGYGMNLSVFDTVETFGRSMISNLNNLPDNFNVNRNPLSNSLGGCVFGTDAGSGVCFDPLLSAITNSTFRSRGASLVFSGSRGPWDWGLGATYTHHRYFRPTTLTALDPSNDRVFSVNGNLGRSLSRTSSIDLNAYANWYDSDLAGEDPLFGSGIGLGYQRSFLLDRMQLRAALGLDHSSGRGEESTGASGLVGLRYSFE
jgi:hypothetical protein